MGPVSGGDTPEAINTGLLELQKKECDIIVGAAGSRGATQKRFSNNIVLEDLYWVFKPWEQSSHKTTRSAKQTANQVHLLIDALIDSGAV